MDKNTKLTSPLISIIMPCYNEEQRIKRAIDSILNQTFKNFEFIIIDDKSSDNTPKFIQEYTQLDKRIVFIQNVDNVGYAENLNRGIEIAKSNIICRMDADDYSFPDRLEKQYQFLMSHPEIDIVGTSARLVDRETGSFIADCHLHEKHEDIVKNKYTRSFNFHPSIMARKELFIQNGGYDVTILRAEEYHLWLKAYSKFKFHNIQDILIEYSVKNTNSLLRFDYFLSGLKVRVKHMVEKKELIRHLPVLVRYTFGYFLKRLLNNPYFSE